MAGTRWEKYAAANPPTIAPASATLPSTQAIEPVAANRITATTEITDEISSFSPFIA